MNTNFNKMKAEELLEMIKAGEIFKKQQEEAIAEKKSNKVIWVLAIIGAIAVIASIAYAVYLYFTPDYLEDFEDDFDDDFDDDFFEDEDDDDDIVPIKPADSSEDK